MSWSDPTSRYQNINSPLDDLGLIQEIRLGFEARGYEPRIGHGRTDKDLIIRCQVTPNSLFEFGCGPGRKLAWRFKSGSCTDADKYFSDETVALFKDWRFFMGRQAYAEGLADWHRKRVASLQWQTRWKGTEWETVYDEGFSGN